jgi:hypothetical protein
MSLAAWRAALGQCTSKNFHLKTTPANLRKGLAGARYETITRVEKECAAARELEGREHKERGVPLAVQILAHGDAAFKGSELRPRHAARPLQLSRPA